MNNLDTMMTTVLTVNCRCCHEKYMIPVSTIDYADYVNGCRKFDSCFKYLNTKDKIALTTRKCPSCQK